MLTPVCTHSYTLCSRTGATGYTAADDTWEPAENIPASMIDDFEAMRAGLNEETDDENAEDAEGKHEAEIMRTRGRDKW